MKLVKWHDQKSLALWERIACKIIITGLTLYPTWELTRYILDYMTRHGGSPPAASYYSFSWELSVCMWIPWLVAMGIMWIWWK